MNINKLAVPVAAAAAAVGIAIGSAGPAWAINNIKPFGVQETLKYNHGDVEIGYTVTGLNPSSDPVPYPAAGQLYEATVAIDSVSGWVNPMVSYFNARAQSGHNYRVINNGGAPNGLSSAAVPPGGQTTGKIYFDVVGDVPNSVVYNDGTTDLLAWVP